MEKFDSISHFLESGEFDYRIFDMGRKVWEIKSSLFKQIENQVVAYPYPFQKKAWMALLFWPKNKQEDAVIWFLQFPIDELGFLKQESRDGFLIDLLEQTGKNIQAKQQGEKIEDGLGESPFAFKPREDRLAMFHAIATHILNQAPSQHYQYAHDYLLSKEEGGPGFEQWQFLGLQGLADVIARLDVDNNEALLEQAVAEMPEPPLSSYAQSLENIEFGKGLFDALVSRINAESSKDEINVVLIAALIRAISSYPKSKEKTVLLKGVLQSSLSAEIEIIAAISGRAWCELEDEEMCFLFVDKLAQQEQMAFSAILADLLMIPNMRELILGVMRSEQRSPELAKKFGLFMQGVAN